MNNYKPTEMLAEEMMARMTAANRTIDELRADIATLCYLLRNVRYTQTVGEINRIRMTCDAVEARWKIKAVQP